MKLWYYAIVVLAGISSCKNDNSSKIETPINRIVFGSCSREADQRQMWAEIDAEQADLFILCGDNIYGDTEDMALMKKKYDHQKNHPDYQRLISNTPVIGVWDDHDYGINDGGKYFSKKDESKQLMLDFFDVPKDDPIRRHTGAYNSYTYGSGNKKVKVILLDVRYFRDTLMPDTLTAARYLPNETGDILGEEQWKWLEEQLTNSDAAIHILTSGIQVIPEEHIFEKWANFPAARKRLFSLLVKTQPKGTFFISGDRHIAELSKISIDGLPYPLYDFTASGLTHTWSEEWPENNSYRIGDLIIKKNYGVIDIDWDQKTPKLTLKVKGHNDSTYFKHSFSF